MIEKHNGPNKLELVKEIIPESGLSQDYLNDFSAFHTFIKRGGLQILRDVIKQINWKPKTYEECYPVETYQNPVNDANRESVKKLNAEVEKFRNRLATDFDNLTIEDFNTYFQTVMSIVEPGRVWMDES
jgi:hypothetical protein